MNALTSDVSALLGYTGIAVVLSIVCFVLSGFLARLAKDLLGNL